MNQYPPDYVIAHTFGPEVGPDGQVMLADATERSFLRAVNLYERIPTARMIIMAVEEGYFWPGCFADELGLKEGFLHRRGIPYEREVGVTSFGIRSTIHEIVQVRDMLEGKPVTIVAISNPYHLRRVRAMWKKLYPQATVYVKSADSTWSGRLPIFWLKSEFRVLVSNILHLIVFKIKGEKADRIRHKVKK